ncbi:MAG: hypothetical protein JSS28_01200 [Proteobacteria bacterium]|nr:hypothetical protein [Pseudomonadota bacterium]
MHRTIRFASILAACAGVGYAQAQSSSGQFGITHSVIAPATPSSGGRFGLTGTVGQPIAANGSAGQYQLLGGFTAANVLTDRIFSNGFEQ